MSWAGLTASTDLDDDSWQDMPVIRADPAEQAGGYEDEDRRRYRWNPPTRVANIPSTGPGAGAGAHDVDPSATPTATSTSALGNATGKLLDIDASGTEWRQKDTDQLDEMDYTRLELDDDPDEDEVSMRTQYLFNEDKGMTPLSQMQQTKTLLSEGQRIAYVGLCRLVAREMVQTLALASKGAKELEPARESAVNWANKIMGRLYRHMDLNAAEQKMIELLAEHGVTAEDLVPALATTFTMDNPEYDPDYSPDTFHNNDFPPPSHPTPPPGPELSDSEGPASKPANASEEAEVEPRSSLDKGKAVETEEERIKREEEEDEEELGRVRREVAKIELREAASTDPFSDPFGSPRLASPRAKPSPRSRKASADPFDQEGVGDIGGALALPRTPKTPKATPIVDPFSEDGGDIGGALDSPPRKPSNSDTESPSDYTLPPLPPEDASEKAEIPESTTPRATTPTPRPASPSATSPEPPLLGEPTSGKQHHPENFLSPLPSSLPGVSKTLTAADKFVTLDIRWTILCDLFLSLIADSVYDARSRVLLGKVADKLGLDWTDLVRFERRLTEALEIQESVKAKEHEEVLEGHRLKRKKQRLVMMGLATLGGGLVIGLSAGLLAPVIGAGLGAALTTVGVSGTTGFLAGAGGAAVISSGATLTGSLIGGRAMAKRTRDVKTFDFQPLHNNKRVNYYITIPGFMNGPLDDVRLPFSVMDPVLGDVFSVLWEPEMMGDTGNALKILSSEVLTQAGQQVLALTVMTALMSALQWPMMLTKLSYLIDNPWSNALDRARQAGSVLADILINRRLGVRPVSLVGFSLGARVIFYALVELAKANAFGVVQEVYLFGATLTASKKVWRQVRGVVSGRFVNAFAMNDWVLGYLFRATSGGLQTVAGLRPIEHVPDLENIDITHILVGHMSYRNLMPQLLAHVGFKVTADHFDEPEEMDMEGDREVLTKEEEERRKEKKAKKGLGIFRRKKKTDTNGSSTPKTPDPDDYDLPPRLSAGSASSLPNSDDGSSRGAHGLGIKSDGGPSGRSSLSISSSVESDEKVAEGEKTGKVQEAEHSDDEELNHAQKEGEEKASSRPEVKVVEPSSPAEVSKPIGFNLEKLRNEVASLPRSASPTEPTFPRTDPISSTGPPPTDLTNLDGSLDPRELLRRQWAEPTLDQWAPPAAPPLRAAASMTFGIEPSTSAWGAPTNGIGASRDDDELETPSFAWGKVNESTASLRPANPW
ncbi:DUF726-domain-containing protein [Meredithblackwellia eburnea MCA 4105]